MKDYGIFRPMDWKWDTVDTLGIIQLIIRSEMSENPLQHVTKTFFT